MKKVLGLLFLVCIILSGCTPESVNNFEEELNNGYSAQIIYSKDNMIITQDINYIDNKYEASIEYGEGKHSLEFRDDGFLYYNDINPSISSLVDSNLIYDRPEDLIYDLEEYLSNVNSDGVYNDEDISITLVEDTLEVKDEDLTINVSIGGENE